MIRSRLWPEGEQENLVAAHDGFFLQAMTDVQNAVECLRFGNTEVYPHCSTYFNCGTTVVPAPRGNINRVFTVGKSSSLETSLVAEKTFDASLSTITAGFIDSPDTVETIASIEEDSAYTVQVSCKMLNSSLYPANSPQYFRVEISYTDTSGNKKSIQPVDLIHVNNDSVSNSVYINAKAGTDIVCTVSPFNFPTIDGTLSVSVKVDSGIVGADSSDWCEKVFYSQVDFCHLNQYAASCSSCGKSGLTSAVVDTMLSAFFGKWRRKTRFPKPTDEGVESMPLLPSGYHYPQKSTDAGGRSPGGVFAIHRGRIYVAPWIESSEELVIEWDGTKPNWSDDDYVESDPKFIEVVTLMVAIQHYTFYEDNPQRLNTFKARLHGEPGAVGALQDLIVDCRERNRVRSCNELGSKGSYAFGIGMAQASASGSGSGQTPGGTGLFFNEQQSYKARCDSNQTGAEQTAVIPAGMVSSSLSVADANAKAQAQAEANAKAKLECSDAGLFYSKLVTYTASCPAATGTTPKADGADVTVTIPAGTYKSTVSQAYADAAAEQAAQQQAKAQLQCVYKNAEQTYEAECPSGTTGSSGSYTVAPGTFTSEVSQEDADQKALAEAQSQVSDQLSANCTGSIVVSNTLQSTRLNGTRQVGCTNLFNYDVTGICNAGEYNLASTEARRTQDQLAVNQMAKTAATQRAQALVNVALADFYQNRCQRISVVL